MEEVVEAGYMKRAPKLPSAISGPARSLAFAPSAVTAPGSLLESQSQLNQNRSCISFKDDQEDGSVLEGSLRLLPERIEDPPNDGSGLGHIDEGWSDASGTEGACEEKATGLASRRFMWRKRAQLGGIASGVRVGGVRVGGHCQRVVRAVRGELRRRAWGVMAGQARMQVPVLDPCSSGLS
jgi:hypothetical protein